LTIDVAHIVTLISLSCRLLTKPSKSGNLTISTSKLLKAVAHSESIFNAPTGIYTVILELFDKNGKLLESSIKKVTVEKTGLNSMIFYLAHRYSFFYGFVSVIIAILLGISAGLIFRRFF